MIARMMRAHDAVGNAVSTLADVSAVLFWVATSVFRSRCRS